MSKSSVLCCKSKGGQFNDPTPSTMDRVNRDLLCLIFEFLDVSGLSTVARVSMFFHQCSVEPRVWRALCLNYLPPQLQNAVFAEASTTNLITNTVSEIAEQNTITGPSTSRYASLFRRAYNAVSIVQKKRKTYCSIFRWWTVILCILYLALLYSVHMVWFQHYLISNASMVRGSLTRIDIVVREYADDEGDVHQRSSISLDYEYDYVCKSDSLTQTHPVVATQSGLPQVSEDLTLVMPQRLCRYRGHRLYPIGSLSSEDLVDLGLDLNIPDHCAILRRLKELTASVAANGISPEQASSESVLPLPNKTDLAQLLSNTGSISEVTVQPSCDSNSLTDIEIVVIKPEINASVEEDAPHCSAPDVPCAIPIRVMAIDGIVSRFATLMARAFGYFNLVEIDLEVVFVPIQHSTASLPGGIGQVNVPDDIINDKPDITKETVSPSKSTVSAIISKFALPQFPSLPTFAFASNLLPPSLLIHSFVLPEYCLYPYVVMNLTVTIICFMLVTCVTSVYRAKTQPCISCLQTRINSPDDTPSTSVSAVADSISTESLSTHNIPNSTTHISDGLFASTLEAEQSDAYASLDETDASSFFSLSSAASTATAAVAAISAVSSLSLSAAAAARSVASKWSRQRGDQPVFEFLDSRQVDRTSLLRIFGVHAAVGVVCFVATSVHLAQWADSVDPLYVALFIVCLLSLSLIVGKTYQVAIVRTSFSEARIYSANQPFLLSAPDVPNQIFAEQYVTRALSNVSLRLRLCEYELRAQQDSEGHTTVQSFLLRTIVLAERLIPNVSAGDTIALITQPLVLSTHRCRLSTLPPFVLSPELTLAVFPSLPRTNLATQGRGRDTIVDGERVVTEETDDPETHDTGTQYPQFISFLSYTAKAKRTPLYTREICVYVVDQ